MLPGLIHQSLVSILERQRAPSPSLISDALSQAIADFDKNIGDALLRIFPDKLALMDMQDEDVRSIINDGGPTSDVVLRCMRGSTALISITDPSNSNLWVASLGDSAASKYGDIDSSCLIDKYFSSHWYQRQSIWTMAIDHSEFTPQRREPCRSRYNKKSAS